jgi:hypothetical protein
MRTAVENAKLDVVVVAKSVYQVPQWRRTTGQVEHLERVV